MVKAENEARERARIIHDIDELMKADEGSLWRERAIDPSAVGRDGGNPCYVMATGSGKADTAYVAFCIDDGSGHSTGEEHGIFLPQEHQLTFPLVEVTDGTRIVIGN